MTIKKTMTCIVCPIGCELQVEQKGDKLIVTGNKCPRGEQYAIEEITAPKRVLTSTIKINNWVHPVIPVRTSKPIPKEKIFAVMNILSNLEVTAPVKLGQVVINNILDTEANIIITRSANI